MSECIGSCSRHGNGSLFVRRIFGRGKICPSWQYLMLYCGGKRRPTNILRNILSCVKYRDKKNIYSRTTMCKHKHKRNGGSSPLWAIFLPAEGVRRL